MNEQKKDAESVLTGAKEQQKKKRKIVIYPEQLFEIMETPKEILTEAKEMMEAMPGIGFEYALGIAKYNAGKAEHPLVTPKK